MIKLDSVGRKAIYFTSPYFSNIKLTGARIDFVKWDTSGKEGVMIVDKNNTRYKIGLFPKIYKGKDNLKASTMRRIHSTARKITARLSRVGTPNFKLGYIYNLSQMD